MVALCHQVSATFGTLSEHVGTDLTVFGIVLVTLLCALFGDICIHLRQFGTVVGVPGHESSVQGRNVCNIPTELETPGHRFAFVSALVGTPLAHFGGFVAEFDAFALFLAQVVDLGNGFSKGHSNHIYGGLVFTDGG